MPDALVLEWLGFISGALAQDGELYATVILGERLHHEWQGFPVIARSLDAYADWAAARGLCMEDVGRLGTLGHHSGSSQDEQVMLRFTRARGG